MDGEVKSPVWVEENAESQSYYRLTIGPFTCRVDQITELLLDETDSPELVGMFYTEVTHGEYDTEIWSGYCNDLESGKQTAVRKLKEHIAKIMEQLEAICGTQAK